MGKTHMGAVSKVEFPNADGTCTAMESQDDVKAAVMKNNEAHFWLTETAPFMQEPLCSEVGFFSMTEAAQQMLEGTCACPEGTDEFTKYFAACLKASNQSTMPINIEIMAQDCKDCWNKVKELTSSSYSGLHFSHWKAATRSNWLSEVHALSIEIACSRGFLHS